MPAVPSLTSEACAAWYDRASCAYQAGRYEAALSAVDKVFESDSTHAAGLHLRGLAWFALGDGASAEHWIARAIDAQPNADFFNSLCVVQTHLRAFPDTVRSARRGLSLQPDMPLLHYNMGLALQLQGKLEEAAASYQRTLELPLVPRHAVVYTATSRRLDRGACGDLSGS